MNLIIAEKPSVAQTLAAVVGATKRCPGYLLGQNCMVSWCIGHLVEPAPAQQYNPAYARWRREDLPIRPNPWQYQVIERSRRQYDVLNRLLHDTRVDGVICATDAGREGELIFRLVYEQSACTLPVQRLWISSLEESAIREGLKHLKPAGEYDALYHAALCRAQADWLVGINASRLFSLLYGRTLNIGRVMTPTLALIVQREDAIAGFVPETFYTVQLRCGFTASSERITQRSDAERLAQACCGQLLTVKHIQHRPRAEKPPRLYDLTTLQREANRVYGFTAQQTLDYAQQLYEKKLITYPRTDSKYLTHDMAEILPLLVQGVSARMPCMTGLDLPVHAPHVIRDEKVSDHHAIIPTRSMLRAELDGLPAGEADILNLIAARLICAVSDEYRYDDTEVTLECAGHPFTARGRAIHQMGWQIPLNTFRGSLGSRILPREDVKQLPELTVGQQLKRAEASVQESQTTPPRHYTEDSLLAAMENAGRSDMPADAERRGLGTPATRAAILEKLVRTGLAERQTAQRVQQLLPTAKGRTLIAVMPEQLKSPAMTAEWEQRLHQIERGAASPDSFMADIHAMLDGLVRTAKPDPDAAKHFPSGHESLGICPVCGTAVSETPKGFFCENRACRFGLWKDNRFLASIGRPPTAEMVSALLREGQVQLTGLQSRKTQKNDQAILLLETDEAGQARLRFDHQKKG